jgi:trehalose 6-phosphate synthase
MGFFLHIPWPPRRLLATLPGARQLVESLFTYEVIGFQTEEWLAAFSDYVTHELGHSIDEGYLVTAERRVRLIVCPIGIDAREFAAMSASRDARETCEQMVTSAVGRAMMVGVDRLDYSKGLEERFLGYERLLVEHPQERKEVFLLQIAPPTRESVDTYQRIRSALEALSGRINGAHADLDWVPIHYVDRG